MIHASLPLSTQPDAGESLEDVIARVAASDAGLVIRQVPVEGLRVAPGRLITDDAVYGLSGPGLARFCKALGVPHEYLAKLAPHIRTLLLQHHLERGDLRRVQARDGHDQTPQVTILSRDGKFLGFGRPDLLLLSGADVLRAVRDGVGSDGASMQVHSLQFQPESFDLDLVSPRHAEEVLPGDVIRAGVRVSHSQIGERATSIESYLLRLVCSNGMTHRECVSRQNITRSRRLPNDRPDARQRQTDQVRRLASATWTRTEEKLQALRTLQEEQVDVEELLGQFVRRGRLWSRRLMERLLVAWQQEGGEPTAYAALNAMTRVATHDRQLSERQRRALGSLAGVLAFRSIHICPSCFSVLLRPQAG